MPQVAPTPVAQSDLPQVIYSSIKVQKGNLTVAIADVLVHTISAQSNDLAKSGILGSQFAEKGGSSLQQEYSKVHVAGEFGKDLIKTGVGLITNAKAIYHTPVGPYRDDNSIERMTNCIELCLKNAKKDGFKSIAFPTVGCGNLTYAPIDVVNCFAEAEQRVSGLQIYIIAYEQTLFHIFSQHLQSSATQNEGFISTVESNLPLHRAASVSGSNLTADARAVFEFQIDERNKKERAEELSVNLYHIRKTQGISAYLSKLGELRFQLPDYWRSEAAISTHRLSTTVVDLPEFCVLLKPWCNICKAVTDLVNGTWESDKVGFGANAKYLDTLNYKKISVLNVWHVKNILLFKNYRHQFRAMCTRASMKAFVPIKDLRGGEIKTRQLNIPKLEENLVPEINEFYLFHGTPSENIKILIQQGSDPRLSSSKYFGSGTYFAESSTKADQYADNKDARVGLGQPLYMFIFRVALGEAYVSDRPSHLKRPPCKAPGCKFRDKCKEHAELFDSVLGDTRHTGEPLLFREFIIFQSDLCYPEYLVQYTRTA